jgi:hypothetical protein
MSSKTVSSQAARSENLKDGVLLAAESMAWLAAWLVMPVWLALRETTGSAFTVYAVAVGTLLAFGVLADRGPAFDSPDHFLWFAALNSLAILLLGGAVFGFTLLLLRIVIG